MVTVRNVLHSAHARVCPVARGVILLRELAPRATCLMCGARSDVAACGAAHVVYAAV